MVTPSARREMATKAVTHYAISIRLACRIFKVSESCYRYQPVLVDENQEIADWLLRITASQRNWGFGLCFLYLRNVQGFGWNHKRVYRIYRALEWLITSCRSANNIMPITIFLPAGTASFFYSA